MKPQLEALLKAFDSFDQAATGPEADRLLTVYQTVLEETAQHLKVSTEVLDRVVRRKHPRWVRANLPQGFPNRLAD